MPGNVAKSLSMFEKQLSKSSLPLGWVQGISTAFLIVAYLSRTCCCYFSVAVAVLVVSAMALSSTLSTLAFLLSLLSLATFMTFTAAPKTFRAYSLCHANTHTHTHTTISPTHTHTHHNLTHTHTQTHIRRESVRDILKRG